jgi:hypothetical protein
MGTPRVFQSLISFFALMWILVVNSSCHPQEHAAENFTVYKINEFGNDIKIPSLVWDHLEGLVDNDAHKTAEPKKDLPAAGHGGGHGGGETASAAGPTKKDVTSGAVFAGLKITLKEKNPGVLKDSSIAIELPKGGGEIDLAKYMGLKKGSYYLNFVFPEMQDAQFKKVIFISQAKRRKIDDDIVGAGCNVFFDLTSSVSKNFDKEGIKLNTTRDWHSSVIGGHFLFSAKKDTQTVVSRVTFRDSAHPELFCEE